MYPCLLFLSGSFWYEGRGRTGALSAEAFRETTLLYFFDGRMKFASFEANLGGACCPLVYIGSAVVECLTPDRGAAGSSLTGVTAL